MNVRRAGARRIIDKLAEEIGAWTEWKGNEIVKEGLRNIKEYLPFEKIVAQFGVDPPAGIPLAPLYLWANGNRGPIEEATGRLMSTTVSTLADLTCWPVSTRLITRTREVVEADLA
jgi:hypothetical protein